jgi:hypothetical protein
VTGMKNFLHWRKTTWALIVWSAGMTAWLLLSGPGVPLTVGLWIVGCVVLGFIWFMTQPLFRQGKGMRDGFFVRPNLRRWRMVNLHRS